MSKKDKNNLLGRKIEETFILFTNFSENFHAYYFGEIAFIRGHMTRADANDLVKNSKFGEAGDFQKLEMNVSLCFPELIEELEGILSLRDEVSTANSMANSKKCAETLNVLLSISKSLKFAQTNLKTAFQKLRENSN